MSRFTDLLASPKPLIGVIHLPPLPGRTGSPGIDRVVDRALSDLAALEDAGFDGVLVENEYDRPHEVRASAGTIAAMARVTHEVVRAARRLVVGVEILLNDPEASVSVAVVAGASFIRTDYFVDHMTRPEYGGEMAIDPAGLLAHRERMQAHDVLILADIQVKYATMIAPRPLEMSADAARAAGADAVVVTGTVTGDPPRPEELMAARSGAGDLPVLIGSGLDPTNARALLDAADGAIVGTSLQGQAGIDVRAARALVRASDRRTSGTSCLPSPHEHRLRR